MSNPDQSEDQSHARHENAKIAGTRRISRYVHFKEFLGSANGRFMSLCEDDEDARRFDALYSLCVTPGGRMGGLDKRRLEVFFGQRPYDVHEDFGERMQTKLRVLAERGAALEYVQDDLGRVHCYLHPAASEGMKPVEDFIRLGTIDEPSSLMQPQPVGRHFKFLIDYMQCRSLDGAPRLADKALVAWMRFTRQLAIDERMQAPRAWVTVREILKFSATVGLSGFLLAGIVWMFSRGQTQEVVLIRESAELSQQRALVLDNLRRQADLLERTEKQLSNIRDRLDQPFQGIPANRRQP